MMNYIWAFMVIASFVCAAAGGRMSELTASVFSGGSDAVALAIKLLGTLCLWCGLMNIAEKSGLCGAVARLLSPILNLLFPSFRDKKEVKNAISMNITANLFGLGNAATPLGLKAMERMQELNGNSDRATVEMMTFVVMNTAAMRLIPSTTAALRQAAGAREPMDIIVCVWISSSLALLGALSAVKLLGRRRK